MHYAPSVKRNGWEEIELNPLDAVADSLGIHNVGFVSMDIDGHEAAFFRGAREMLTRDRPPIAMEFAQRCLHFASSDIRELAALCHGMGYEICSEATRCPYESELAFLTACGNFNCDCNALALPRSGKPKWTLTNQLFPEAERMECSAPTGEAAPP